MVKGQKDEKGIEKRTYFLKIMKIYVNNILVFITQRREDQKVFFFVLLVALWENFLRQNKPNLTLIYVNATSHRALILYAF